MNPSPSIWRVGLDGLEDDEMRYDVIEKVNSFAGSRDYGKVFGFDVIDTRENKKVATFLRHEYFQASVWLPQGAAKRFLKRWMETDEP